MDTITFKKGFAADVKKGLCAENKFLSSRYFYDATGDKLFQKIMQLPEYYLTRAEFAILDQYKAAILQPVMERKERFNLVELGAGDGLKTKILIQYLYEHKLPFDYFPIDISGNVLKELKISLGKEFPQLPVHTIENTYTRALEEKKWNPDSPTLMVFLGSNMGNFLEEDALDLLTAFADALDKNEMLLAGFDLKKDPELILKAYNDSEGVTRDFNLNILSRINRELGGNFDTKRFKHWPVYNPASGECKSYLVSEEKQTVYIEALSQVFTFEKAEAIYTEVSKKYSLRELGKYAKTKGFEVMDNFLDERGYFTDSLWRKA
ncbi:MAG: L-histidine N(alpha)-methyltransferase [Anditalea sp.]